MLIPFQHTFPHQIFHSSTYRLLIFPGFPFQLFHGGIFPEAAHIKNNPIHFPFKIGHCESTPNGSINEFSF